MITNWYPVVYKVYEAARSGASCVCLQMLKSLFARLFNSLPHLFQSKNLSLLVYFSKKLTSKLVRWTHPLFWAPFSKANIRLCRRAQKRPESSVNLVVWRHKFISRPHRGLLHLYPFRHRHISRACSGVVPIYRPHLFWGSIPAKMGS